MANWLRMGNRNTTFFHNFASYRKKRNTIKGIEDESGRWVEGDEELLEVATNYF